MLYVAVNLPVESSNPVPRSERSFVGLAATPVAPHRRESLALGVLRFLASLRKDFALIRVRVCHAACGSQFESGCATNHKRWVGIRPRRSILSDSRLTCQSQLNKEGQMSGCFAYSACRPDATYDPRKAVAHVSAMPLCDSRWPLCRQESITQF
jgi:hypothetical protein